MRGSLWRFGFAAAAIALAGCAMSITEAVPVPVIPSSTPIDVLLAQLASPTPQARQTALWELARVKDADDRVVEALLRARRDANEGVRDAAVWAISRVGSGGRPSDLDYDSPPRLLTQAPPEYPKAAFEKKIQGVVLVEILIGESGGVVHAEVRRSIPALDDAARTCVRRWTFEPARKDGKPVAAIAHAPVSFRIY